MALTPPLYHARVTETVPGTHVWDVLSCLCLWKFLTLPWGARTQAGGIEEATPPGWVGESSKHRPYLPIRLALQSEKSDECKGSSNPRAPGLGSSPTRQGDGRLETAGCASLTPPKHLAQSLGYLRASLINRGTCASLSFPGQWPGKRPLCGLHFSGESHSRTLGSSWAFSSQPCRFPSMTWLQTGGQ